MANFNKRTLVIIGVFLGILLIIGGAIIITVKVRNSSKEDTEKGKRLVVKINTNQPTPAGASTPDPKITPTGQQSAPEDIKDPGSPNTPDPEVKPTEAPKPQNTGGDGVKPPVRPAMNADIDDLVQFYSDALDERAVMLDKYRAGDMTRQEYLDYVNGKQAEIRAKRKTLSSKYGDNPIFKDLLDQKIAAVTNKHRNSNKGRSKNTAGRRKVIVPVIDSDTLFSDSKGEAKVTIDGKRYTDMGNGKLKGEDGIVESLVGLALLLVIVGLFYLEGRRIH